MQPRKLQIGIMRYPYAGNGGSKSEIPEVATWLAMNLHKIKSDPRTEEMVHLGLLADTPITMTRNATIQWAQKRSIDVLLMIDSDQAPDILLSSDVEAKPFWDSSFDFLYRHWDKGPCCIGAPYLGAPPHPVMGGSSNAFVFRWGTSQDDPNTPECELAQYTREEAALSRGIHEVAALPTGCYMIDMRTVDNMEPPWFHYEWTDKYESEKASTEDVVFTRNASMIGVNQYCNWDAWAGHAKMFMTARPRILFSDQIHDTLVKSVERGIESNQRIREPNPGGLEPLHEDAVKHSFPVVSRAPEYFGRFRVVQRKYSLDICEPSSNGQLMFNTTDGELDALRDVVARAAQMSPDTPLNILEIGSWAGASAAAMHAGFGPKGGHIWCVDTWQGSQTDVTGVNTQEIGIENVKAMFDRNTETSWATAVCQTSESASTNECLPDHFDVIFIDGDHSYKAAKYDIQTWVQRLTNRGVICGHDYREEFPGVHLAIDEVLQRVETLGCFWWSTPPHCIEVPASAE